MVRAGREGPGTASASRQEHAAGTAAAIVRIGLSLELHERGRSRLHYAHAYITLTPTLRSRLHYAHAYITLSPTLRSRLHSPAPTFACIKEHPVAVCDISFYGGRLYNRRVDQAMRAFVKP